MVNEKKRPDFIGVGVQRSGTSFLQACLDQHPQVGKPRRGLHFFSHDKRYNPDLSIVKPNDLTWYETELGYFSNYKVVGEYSVTYSFPEYLDTVASKINRLYPEIKIIIALRNPVDRLVSEYRRLLERSEINSNIKFNDFIEIYPSIVRRGFYSLILETYYSLFPKERIHVKIFEDLTNKGIDHYLSTTFDFLDVDPFFRPIITKNPNPSMPIKNSLLGSFFLLARHTGVKMCHTKYGYFVSWIKKTDTWQKIKEINSVKTKIDTTTIRKLLNIYESDIKKVEMILSRDLSIWR